MTSSTSESIASRFSVGTRAEPFRLRPAAPHVHGYAWRHDRPDASLVLVHGFQSHAQWFAEAGELLLDSGLSVYAVDRRGSGSSPEERGHIERYGDWLDEVEAVVALARRDAPTAPVHLVGHCFGANVAMGAALERPLDVASIVMLTPGLYVLPDYTPGEKAAIGVRALTGSHRLFRAPQHAELFSRDREVVAWIRADRLGAQRLTARCLVEAARLQRRVRRGAVRLALPVLVLEAERDRISDNARNRAALEAALGERCRRVTFDAEHFLLAEPCRDAVLDTVARWVADGSAS